MSITEEFNMALDQVVNELGLTKSTGLLKSFLKNLKCSNDVTKVKLVKAFIINQSIQLFAIQEAQFLTSTTPEYKEARMACYQILYQYTQSSHALIGELFHKNKRHVLHYCTIFKEIMEVPHTRRSFVEKYNTLEEQTIAFIGKLN